MDIFSLPFNKFLGLAPSPDPAYLMVLPAKTEYENHLQTVHAAALFALAEASSGLFLLREFADVENAVPVVRNADVKYRKPAKGVIFSTASLGIDKAELLLSLHNKHRALVPVHVSLYDTNAVLVMQATFNWFVLIDNGWSEPQS
jgi:acyl-coenzyme A thioesterase PaaI-like protein